MLFILTNQKTNMLAFLKNHPFAVEAFFKSSIVLTFAVPKEQLETLIPDCLSLDLHDNKWAFIAMAMVDTTDLRPKGFPKFMGNNFFLVGYRVFVRYTNKKGKKLRGLYILKSETNKAQMAFMGNIFTHYNYTKTDITQTLISGKKNIYSNSSKFTISMDTIDAKASLPKKSPFQNWKEARRFAGPLPFTFTYNEKNKEVLIIQGVRTNWKPKPIKIDSYHISFFNKLGLNNPILANAFIIENIPYYWKKGEIELWK